MIAMEVARNNDHVYTLGNCCFRREATYYDARLGGSTLAWEIVDGKAREIKLATIPSL